MGQWRYQFARPTGRETPTGAQASDEMFAAESHRVAVTVVGKRYTRAIVSVTFFS